MLWLIWIAIMLLVPVGAGVHVWWQLRRAPQDGEASPQPAQRASQGAVSSTDGIPPH
jgi:hypothetical protein